MTIGHPLILIYMQLCVYRISPEGTGPGRAEIPLKGSAEGRGLRNSWLQLCGYRIIVASLSGPTEMILIGTPRKFSMNAM